MYKLQTKTIKEFLQVALNKFPEVFLGISQEIFLVEFLVQFLNGTVDKNPRSNFLIYNCKYFWRKPCEKFYQKKKYWWNVWMNHRRNFWRNITAWICILIYFRWLWRTFCRYVLVYKFLEKIWKDVNNKSRSHFWKCSWENLGRFSQRIRIKNLLNPIKNSWRTSAGASIKCILGVFYRKFWRHVKE